MEDKQIFSKNLTNLMKAYGYTQEYIAEKVHLERTIISRWKAGQRYPGTDTMQDLAQLFNISVYQLESQLLDVYKDSKTGEVKVAPLREDIIQTRNDVMFSITSMNYVGLPRLGEEMEDAYRKYVEALNLDCGSDLDAGDERMENAIELYQYAFDHGIMEAGANLLRLLIFTAFCSGGAIGENERIVKNYVKTVVSKMRGKHPAGDYYDAICIMHGYYPNEKPNSKEGIRLMHELAQAGNQYAMYYHGDGEVNGKLGESADFSPDLSTFSTGEEAIYIAEITRIDTDGEG